MGAILNQYGKPVASTDFYQGASTSRERTALPIIVGDSSRTLTPYVRTTSMGLARLLAENIGLLGGAVAERARYSVGPGLKAQSLSKDKEAAREHEAYFREWEPVADISGKRTFGGLQHLISTRLDVDGEIGAAKINNAIGQLQMIESHRITSPSSNTDYYDGAKINKNSFVTHYMVKEGDNYRPLSTNDFTLIYEPKRGDQVRGLTAFHHALNNARDILQILGFEKMGVKMISAIGVVITSDNGEADEAARHVESGYTAADTGSVAQETWQAGMIHRLKTGESITSVAGDRQNSTFNGFLEFLIRDIAVGMGLPFEFIWNPEKVGGAGNRFIIAKAARSFDERQRTIERFCSHVWSWVIGRAIAKGEIRPSDDFHRVRWQGPARITVDVGREAQANREDLKLGIRTHATDAAERGIDWQEERDQTEAEVDDLIVRADRVATARNKPFPLVLETFRKSAPMTSLPLEEIGDDKDDEEEDKAA